MPRLRTAIAAALAILALTAHVRADHCPVYDSDDEIATPATGVSLSAHEVGGENPGIYYVDNDGCQPKCAFSVWIYEETNGEPGLQRGDEYADDCQYLEPDTIIF